MPLPQERARSSVLTLRRYGTPPTEGADVGAAGG